MNHDHSVHETHEHSHSAHEHSHSAHDHSAMMSDPSMAKRMEHDMARRFWIALALTVPPIPASRIHK